MPVHSAIKIMAEHAPKIARDWVSKSIAGTLLGLALGLAAGGAVMRLSTTTPMIAAQFAMWIVPPVWMGVLSLCFLFRDGLRTWLWLGAATLLAYALLYAPDILRHMTASTLSTH